MTVVIDTNIVLYFLQGNKKLIPLVRATDFIVPFIVEIELLSYPNLKDNERKAIETFLEGCVVYDYNQKVKSAAIDIRKESRLKLPDAFVVATARALDLPLISADKIFLKVPQIRLIEFEL